ncbi:MAG TPA: acetoacetate decarboxylase family protein [Marmoricola sp.]|nr:acetoacetate decarboxylase family protein [Marmoricola sp.]
MTEFDIAGVPGVPETILPAGLIADLPANLAPAPWNVRGSAVVWWNRANAAAAEALPETLRATHKPVMVIGGFVRYANTPVGTYDEVFGIVASKGPGGPKDIVSTVAFMAVDSPTSLVGGRTNWSMPKTLASFDGAPDGEMTARSGSDRLWTVTSRARALPFGITRSAKAVIRQAFPDGSVGDTAMESGGRMRPALISVGVESDGPLAEWLKPGRRVGMILENVKMDFTAAQIRPA